MIRLKIVIFGITRSRSIPRPPRGLPIILDHLTSGNPAPHPTN
jgi:hypothetical protein